MSLIEALEPVVEALDALGIEYHIGGSVASSSHGVPRATNDVDIVVDLRREHVKPLCDALGDAYYASPALLNDAVARRSSANLIHFATGYKVDVFVLDDTPYHKMAFSRHVERHLGNAPSARRYRVSTPEDSVLQKLLWYRAGGESSDRQWSDVTGLLRARGESLDATYLDRWARDLGVDDLLREARRQVNG